MELLRQILGVKAVVIFQKPKGAQGEVWMDGNNKMFISLTSQLSPARIYLHECLHVLYPNWSERKVLNAERRIWRRLSVYQRYLLYKRLFSHPFKGGGL